MENNEYKNADGYAAGAEHPFPEKSERQWGMGCHLAVFAGYLMPFLAANVLGPLIIWLLKREESTFVDEQGKESLNFQLSLLIYSLACGLLFFVGIGAVLLFPLAVFGLICPIIGAVKASEGTSFRYPLCIHFIK